MPDLVPFSRCARAKAWGPFLRRTLQKGRWQQHLGLFLALENCDVIPFFLFNSKIAIFHNDWKFLV